jgi:hypothetical protein
MQPQATVLNPVCTAWLMVLHVHVIAHVYKLLMHVNRSQQLSQTCAYPRIQAAQSVNATPWIRALLQKLRVAQLVKFPAFYGT